MRSAIFSSTLARSAGRGAAPAVGGGMGGVEREFDVLGARARGLGVDGLPLIGVMTSKYWPFTGGTNLPLMKLSYCAA